MDIGSIVGLAILFIIGVAIIVLFDVLGPIGASTLLVVLVAAPLAEWFFFKDWRHERRLQARADELEKQLTALPSTLDVAVEKLIAADLDGAVSKRVMLEFLSQEGLLPPQRRPEKLSSVDGGRYIDRLQMLCNKANTIDAFTEAIAKVLDAFRIQENADGLFATEKALAPDELQSLIEYVLKQQREYGHFAVTARQLEQNIEEQDCLPTKYKGGDLADDYLQQTPLLHMATYKTRTDIYNRDSHVMLLGSSGSGKTNLIEHLISHDLLRSMGDDLNERYTVVVVDSQRQLIPKLANIDIPPEFVTYLNPQWDMGINLFDVDYGSLAEGVEKETATNRAVGLIRFVLEGALEGRMTDRQRTMFDYAIQLVITIPGGNMLTFLDLLRDKGVEKYAEYVEKFDPITQEFFENDWGSPDYRKTRDAIRARLLTLIKNPTFRRIFSATKNNFRVYDELKNRALILLDTDKPLLDQEGSSFLGRLYVAMIMQAAYRRFENRGHVYHPVHLYIDEAHEVFDERIAEMLEQARKANIGLLLSHQTISQIRKSRLDPATVIGNTATKLVSTRFYDDAREMAKSMRVKPEDILNLPEYIFGLYDREQGFVPVSAPQNSFANVFGTQDMDALRAAMEARYGNQQTASPIPPEPKSRGTGHQQRPPPSDIDLGTNEPI